MRMKVGAPTAPRLTQRDILSDFAETRLLDEPQAITEDGMPHI
jgi:hypothetical protein